MIENIVTDHEIYLKNINKMKDDFNKHIQFLNFKLALEKEPITELKITLPLCSQNLDYFYKKNYQYFSDKFNSSLTFYSDNNNFIIDYKNTTISMEELDVLEKDVNRIFDNTLGLLNLFYESFELPFSKNPTADFVLNYLSSPKNKFNRHGIWFNFFIPYLNKIEDLGILLDLNDVDDPNNAFAFYAGGRIKFINRDQFQMEYFRQNIDVLLIGIYAEESQIWFRNAICHLKINQFHNFMNSLDHIRDYLNSEDIKQIFPIMHKISFNDMMIRSQKWLNKISKVKIKEMPGDCEIVFKEDNYDIVQLLTTNALDRESSYLSHCIGRGSYDHCLEDNSSKLYSIRNKKNEPIATIEVSPNNAVIQIQGYQNTFPDPSVKPIIKRFFKDRNISFENYRHAYAFVN